MNDLIPPFAILVQISVSLVDPYESSAWYGRSPTARLPGDLMHGNPTTLLPLSLKNYKSLVQSKVISAGKQFFTNTSAKLRYLSNADECHFCKCRRCYSDL